jgi:hypothetical protein
MRFNRISAAVLILGAGALAGCGTTEKALGMNKVVPDEFRIVTKAPLVVPPDYALRPPKPGEPSPAELQPESAARAALIGERDASNRSEGEKLLDEKAGGDKADPLIRYVIDDEFGSLAHKDKSFADWVMFWHKGQPASEPTEANSGGDTAHPVDAAVEARRVAKLTGDEPIVIERKGPAKIKLPGL